MYISRSRVPLSRCSTTSSSTWLSAHYPTIVLLSTRGRFSLSCHLRDAAMRQPRASTRSGSGSARMALLHAQNADGPFLSLSSLIRPNELGLPRPRLKLKCDKSVPCSSCMRRGCASICPNGMSSLKSSSASLVLSVQTSTATVLISTSYPYLLLHPIRAFIFYIPINIYSLTLCRKPRYRTRNTVRPLHIYPLGSCHGSLNYTFPVSSLQTPTDCTTRSRR